MGNKSTRLAKCPDCEMMYVPDIPEDKRAHQRFHHDTLRGPRARPLKSDRVIWRGNGRALTCVNSKSPLAQKRRANKAARVANRTTPYDFPPYLHFDRPTENDLHFFLMSMNGRIAGVLVMAQLPHLCRCTWEQMDRKEYDEIQRHPIRWTSNYAWTAPASRRTGLASRMVQEAVRFFGIGPQELGWFPPFTDDGKELVRSICPDSVIIASD